MTDQVKCFGYSDKVAGDLVKMVSNWKNRNGQPVVDFWEATLGNARAGQRLGKISLTDLALEEKEVVCELVVTIAANYRFTLNAHELTDVVYKGQMQCVSCSMLISIVAHSLELKVEGIGAYRAAKEVIGGPHKHVFVLVHLADGTEMLADGASLWQEGDKTLPHVVLKRFKIANAYETVGNFLELKKEYPFEPHLRAIYRRIRKSPLLTFLHYNRGTVDDLTKAIDVDPLEPYAYSARAGIKLRLGQLTEAIEDLTEAIKLNPNDAQVDHHNRGAAFGNLGKWKEAEEDFTAEIGLNPNAQAYSDRGRARWMLGLGLVAREDFVRASELTTDKGKKTEIDRIIKEIDEKPKARER
jgi:tetratricopeptide (TPR) repeat protein